jgi:hypothetical protein
MLEISLMTDVQYTVETYREKMQPLVTTNSANNKLLQHSEGIFAVGVGGNSTGVVSSHHLAHIFVTQVLQICLQNLTG